MKTQARSDGHFLRKHICYNPLREFSQEKRNSKLSTYLTYMIDGTTPRDFLGRSQRNATSNMIMAAAMARPQPSLLDHRAPSSMKEPKSMEYATPRGYSDSIVPHCQAILKNGYEGNDRFTPSTSDLVRTGHCSEIPINKPVSKSQHSKLRQQLQLPSFKSLGISTRRPDALLTPPDEGIIDLKPVGPPILISRSSSYPPSNMPKTPSPDITNFATRLSNELSTAEASGSTPPTTTNADPTEAPGDHGNASLSSSSGGEGADPSQAGWLVEAVELAGKL